MKGILTIFKRELAAYFNSPLAYVLILIFNILSIVLMFFHSRFFQAEDASLDRTFFYYHVWLLLIIGPAIGMRLWSEEQRLGTIELILTMPVAPWQVITGKFFAALVVLFGALLSTFSVVVTVYWLGDPDGRMIFSGYVGSLLTGAAAIAVTCFVSALTRNQVTCLLVSITLLFFLTIIGWDQSVEFMRSLWMGDTLASVTSSLSLFPPFQNLTSGLFTFQNFIFYASVIGFSLYLTSVIIRSKRS